MMMGMIAYFVGMAVAQYSWVLTDRMVSVLLVGVEAALLFASPGGIAKGIEMMILATAFTQVFDAGRWWVGMLRTADF